MCQKNRAALPNISILREKGTANLDTVLLPEFLFNGKQKYTFTVSEISSFQVWQNGRLGWKAARLAKQVAVAFQSTEISRIS